MTVTTRTHLTLAVGTSGKAPPRLRSHTLGDLLDTPLPVREYLLEPLIREGESMMLWAAPGVGKTMAALSMALAVAGGGQFLAWNAPKPRRVLYLDGEMHLGDLAGVASLRRGCCQADGEGRRVIGASLFLSRVATIVPAIVAIIAPAVGAFIGL
jgi:hypothetical protein